MCSTPLYALSPTSSEVTLYDDSTSSSLPQWIYTTKHMRIDLGTRMWGSHVPCYGLNGNIEGSIRFSGNPSTVSKVTVALQVQVTTSEQRSFTLLSRTVPVYTPFSASSTQWNDDCAFSLPIPSEIYSNGGISVMPPSFSYHSYDATCEVSYFVKVCMVRKRNGFNTHESRLIPIMYLPKSEPCQVQSAESKTEMMSLKPMTPQWSGSKKGRQRAGTLGDFDDAVHVSISSTNLASGAGIPFSVKIDTAKHPVLNQVSDKNIHVALVNRVSLWSSSGSSKPVSSEYQISSGSVLRKDGSQSSLVFQGSIQAGCAGEENSWRLNGVVSVEYILRISVIAPRNLLGQLPTFHHDSVITLASDEYGTSWREMKESCGVPAPALGLWSNSCSESSEEAIAFAYVFVC
ncbi:uncharacterized protein EV420DRAFT_1149552 [Desarmillaria tabescens]|uniref:Arrestin-like N-terminal domain-containing protein n=1 Tax=Armillaria tabescens TaxID=1929756 RepID=A0AA39NC98_ARMTA|nr:uncharacterized protein EV420DRAFT_1149552 [Desarmillaria tabescens]KAK0463006.1 hypothetical protein EV420DRAFT_1149552 [Desarmillaria tabescens]